jgi:hypothetical protein
VTELARLRLRVAPQPRPAEALPRPSGAPRRAVLVQTGSAEADGFACAIEMLDGYPVAVVVGASENQFAVAALWAAGQLIGGAAGQPVPIEMVSMEQFGRFVAKRCWNRRAALVMFDSLAQLGPLTRNARRAKVGGGVSLGLVGCGWHHDITGKWMDSYFYPGLRVVVRGGEDGGALLAWVPSARRRKTQRRLGGPFVDMQVLGAALGADPSWSSALTTAYGVKWPDEFDPLDQLLAEALALAEVYRLMLADLAEVAAGMAPQDCWSAGSVITLALRRAGVRSPAETTATLLGAVLGAVASTFHGGRVEALLVGVAMPMSMVDLNGTYPAMFSLLGLTKHLAAHHFEAERVPIEEVEALVAPDGLRERLDGRAWWATVGSLFVQVEPHGEAALPCVREAGDLSGGTLWFHACDLVRPALAGKLPKIVSAFRVLPIGVAPGLQDVRLPNGTECDLLSGDLGATYREHRRVAEALDNPLRRERCGPQAKAAGVSGSYGIFARVDQRNRQRPEDVLATGPDGRLLLCRTKREDRAGPLTIWHLAGAVPAACRAIIAITQYDVEAAGGTVAAVLTDCIVVPAAPESRLEACPGGPHRLHDGREAVKLVGLDDLRAILSRYDPLFGEPAWKGEAGSLEQLTYGLVAGVNKVLLGRVEGGCFHLVRSSDTSLGDHYLDPTGTSERLPDGRQAWSAALEESLLAALVAAGPDGAYRVPKELPPWAELPALRPARATTIDELRDLLADLGDDTVPPFARYLRAGVGGPVCLHTGQDPVTWQDLPWRKDGVPHGVSVLGARGALISSRERVTRAQVVPTIREVFEEWLHEHDVTVTGPARGLRQVAPVHSHAALVELVGRSGEHAGSVFADDPLAFGTSGTDELLAQAAAVGSPALALGGVPGRTARRITAGTNRPRPTTVARLAAAVAEPRPERHCGHCGCVLSGRPQQRWCSDRCRKAALRAADPATPSTVPDLQPATPSADLDEGLALLSLLPGMPVTPRAGRTSTKLLSLLGDCLAVRGVTPELLAERVAADGPLLGRSPVGILVHRLEALASTVASEAEERATSALEGARRWGHRLGGMVRDETLDMDSAAVELARENDPGLRRAALDGFAEGLKGAGVLVGAPT